MVEHAIRHSDNTAPAAKDRTPEPCRSVAAEAYRPGSSTEGRRNEPSTADDHICKGSVLKDGSLQFGANPDAANGQPKPGDAVTGQPKTGDAPQPSTNPDTAKPTGDDAPRQNLPKTEFGKEMDDRYKDRDLSPQQRDFLTRIADNAKGTDDPAQKERMTRWMDRDVNNLEQARAGDRERADHRQNGWTGDASDYRNNKDSGYDKLSPEQKQFVDTVASDFPSNTYQQGDRKDVTKAAIERSQKGELGGDSAKEFTKEQKERIADKLGDAEVKIGDVIKDAADVVEKGGHATEGLHTAAEKLVPGLVAHEGHAVEAAEEAAGTIAKAVPKAESVAGKLLKFAPTVGKFAPAVAAGAYGVAGVTEMAQGNVEEGIHTTAQGAVAVGAGVLGSAACGGPETPLGVACGVAAGAYADHAYDAFKENGFNGGVSQLTGEALDSARGVKKSMRDVVKNNPELAQQAYMMID